MGDGTASVSYDPYVGVEAALKKYDTRKVAVPQTRQGDTDGGLPSMTGTARQRAQLLSFAARFAFELRKHGAFGMNREEGELLKEFDEWVEANGASEREHP